MAEDWAVDVRKYVPDADGDIIAGIVRYCGIALRNRDSSLVSFSDKTETDRVKANFLKKKLGLADADDVLDAAIAAVGERMKADRTKNRVTVYYLLAQAFGRLEDFRPKAKATKAAKASAKPAADDAAAGLPPAAAAPEPVAAAPVVAEPVVAPPPPPPVPVMAAPLAAVPIAKPPAAKAPKAHKAPGLFWPLTAAVVAFGGIAALIILGSGKVAAPPAAAPVVPVPEMSNMPTLAEPVVPDGAGLVTEEREGQPVLLVYFETGKAAVAAGFAEKAADVKAWAASHPGSKYVVSGYNDPTGDAARNAELSKNRAQAVQTALIEAGVAEADIVLEKPPETTDAGASPAQARRVEVIVR
jgi:outer membrane protein OmpA-like peptidoglycan-associated protein